MQAESTKTARSCAYCDAKDPDKAHDASHLTDYHSVENKTHWQSSTMVHNIQYPNSVNLTLNLGKAYEITYIRLTFFSSRPESFAIYKKNGKQSQVWEPFQYFSASCEDTYKQSSQQLITKDNEGQATCRDDNSDISPLTGGTVVFSTLEGRPSAYNYEHSLVLQNWVTATDIMISLNRLNTFGDEVFGDKQVLSQYFYGVYDFSIGGRCKCNGHSSECVNDGGVLKCMCEHNTDGADCEECLPFYNDLPWQKATLIDAHECKPCDCNGLSDTCDFNAELYERTGHGGHCTNCRQSTSGPHCEYCQHGHYHRPQDRKCVFCHCHPLGSRTTQCNDYGVCECQPGVTGEKCDQCLPNYYNLSATGCTKCRCDPTGVIEGSVEQCDTVTGQCYCKEYVTAQSCDQCMNGFFGLISSNPLGCSSCFCYGHAVNCSLDSTDHKLTSIQSTFMQGKDGWTGEGRYGEEANVEHLDVSNEVSLVANDGQSYYFIAPDSYLGDIHRSYGLYITFELRTDSSNQAARPSIDDIIIESANGRTLTLPIFSQENPTPTSDAQEYKFLLSEHPDYQWSSVDLSHFEFIRLLSNVTAIKIRGTYSNQGVGFLSKFSLQTSTPKEDLFKPELKLIEHWDSAAVVEDCNCLPEYDGQFCEGCNQGHKRLQPFSSSFGTCVPCQCHDHGDYCDVESGLCHCYHNTMGDNCEFCEDGYYGNALNGTQDDCQACNCPGGGRCTQLLSTGDVVCLDCPEGYGGLSCDECVQGYYRDGHVCVECNCNNNTHPNAIGVCDRDSGECLRCHYNTMGHSCQQCLEGFYGVPLDSPHGQCHECDCYVVGTLPEEEEDHSGEAPSQAPLTATCDLDSGQCTCRTNVEGLKCDTCVNGTWNIYSGDGCEDCMCDPVGSVDGNCDLYTGRCVCKKGVGGEKCDTPLPLHWGFSITGALECLCDPYGSIDSQCDSMTGQCNCKHQYRGRMCDQCELNRFDLRRGCVECPVCYNIVMEESMKVSQQIDRMTEVFSDAQNLPDNYFEDGSEYNELAKVLRENIKELEDSMENNSGHMDRADELKWYVGATKEVDRIKRVYDNITDNTRHLPDDISTNRDEIKTASEMLESFNDELTNLTSGLETHKTDLLEQIRERQRQSGRQSDELTRVAKEARQILADTEGKLEEIEEKMQEASNKSQQIIQLHYVWSQAMMNLDYNLQDLGHLDALMNENYEMVSTQTQEALERLKALLNESEVVSQEITDLEMPDVESESLNTSSLIPLLKEESQKAEDQHKGLDDLNQNFHQLQRNLSYLLSTTSVALADRNRLNETANDGLQRALNAWKKVEDVFEEANTILVTFKSFDDKIDSSRLKSEEAIASIGDAEKRYPKEIHDKVHEVKVAMFGPGGDVHADDLEYRNLDVLIQVYNRTQDLEKLEKDFSEVENSTNAIDEFVSEVDQQLDDVEAELTDLETENHNETLAVEELQDILHQINSLMASSNEVAERTTKQADNLLHHFEHNLEPIQEEKMKRLNEDIDKLTTPAQEIIQHEIFNTLQDNLESIQNITSAYSDELKQFEYDVQNLEDISRTIPEQCFKPVALEPTYKEE